MSSFFSIPGAKKRKNTTAAAASEKPRKRIATSKGGPNTAKHSGASRAAGAAASSKEKKKQSERDESISGSDIDDDDANSLPDSEGGSGSESDEEDGEAGMTVAERRLKLAENYLSNISKEIQDEVGFDAKDIDRELLEERIQLDVSEAKGRMYRAIADELDLGAASSCYFKNNTDSWTSVAVRAPYAYTTTKDLLVHKWRIQDLPKDQWPQKEQQQTSNSKQKKKKKKQQQQQQKPPPPPKKKPELEQWIRGNANMGKEKTYQRHLDRILCCAVSPDGKFLVTGGEDKRLIVYDAASLKPIKVFSHHRDAVTGLAFRRGTNQLYSCSKDRTVKVWSLDELAYVETLFGHQDQVVDIDALAQERCISVGARDRTARLWKVVDQTQLVFRGGGGGDKKKDKGSSNTTVDPGSLSHEGTMDRIAMLDDDLFVTGGDNGALSLWSVGKKKPLHILPLAHGLEDPLPPTEASADKDPDADVVVPPRHPRWITALKTVPYSDLILSGSWDGHVRAWKLSEDKKKIEPLGALGGAERTENDSAHHGGEHDAMDVDGSEHGSSCIRGIVNDIAVFERGERGRDGICVVVAAGREHRLGRWNMGRVKGKSGGFVFEVPRSKKPEINGEHHPEEEAKTD